MMHVPARSKYSNGPRSRISRSRTYAVTAKTNRNMLRSYAINGACVMVSQPTSDDVVICYRVRDVPAPLIRSFRSTCSQCNEPIWVSYSSPVEPRRVCLECTVWLLEKGTQVGRLSLRQAADALSILKGP
jgi:radical SAM superfamily enzyme with C-terminal helix-hairpin-helix motif